MSDTALYRKYRPKNFKEVIGQDHIVKVLQGTIEQETIAHAYLFSGSRGTGKTSVARIFADVLKTNEKDVYEIDAASNRGIDDIRELRDGVGTLPFESKYKVYIVDEVHMLTKEAFNALLKTLEEPPAHVIFILATTELEKVPDTVVSRCQTFLFKKPTEEILKNVLINIAKKEGYSLDINSAELIALLGDGSFRDSLGILQKVIGATADKKIVLENVEIVTGAPRAAVVNDFLLALVSQDAVKGIAAVHTAARGNVDMTIFLRLTLEKARAALLLRFAPADAGLQDFSENDIECIKKLSSGEKPISSKIILDLITASEQMRVSPISELPLELLFTKEK